MEVAVTGPLGQPTTLRGSHVCLDVLVHAATAASCQYLLTQLSEPLVRTVRIGAMLTYSTYVASIAYKVPGIAMPSFHTFFAVWSEEKGHVTGR